MADRVHLHVDDHPATIALLRALMAGRDLERLAAIGYQPSEHGVWVDWDALAASWLSSTERAVVDVAHALSVFERHGGPPPRLVGPLRDAFGAAVPPLEP